MKRSPVNDPLLRGLLGVEDLNTPELRDGAVALHYRARPASDPGYLWNRSFVGLAVFTPTMQLLKRFDDPVILPGENPDDFDYLGVEDPRVTRIDETYYAVYCGVTQPAQENDWMAVNCLASSQDLIHWNKLGPLRGNINNVRNKDGVLFPEAIGGKYYLLHRPMVGDQMDYKINLAMSDSLTGVWEDCGPVLGAQSDPACSASWVGAGSVPIPLGGKRYLVIYHTGNYLHAGEREYDLDAAIFNFERFSPDDPTTLVEKRIDRIMVPETAAEIRAPFSDSVANVLFTCGTYEYQGYLYIVYGGGDTYIMAARIGMQTLLEHLERSDAPAQIAVPA